MLMCLKFEKAAAFKKHGGAKMQTSKNKKIGGTTEQYMYLVVQQM